MIIINNGGTHGDEGRRWDVDGRLFTHCKGMHVRRSDGDGDSVVDEERVDLHRMVLVLVPVPNGMHHHRFLVLLSPVITPPLRLTAVLENAMSYFAS